MASLNPRRWRGTQVALVVLLALATGVRLWFMLSYRPGFVGYPDARAYIIAAEGQLYFNQFKPVGYPLFLRILHAFDDRLSFAIAVQHLLGLGTALLLYATAVRFVQRSWLALVPVIVVLFSGSQVFLEHSVLSDAPYTFVLALGLYCAVRGLEGDRRLWWLAAAGVALGISLTLRTVGLFILPLVALWIATRTGSAWRARLTAAAVVLGAAAVVLVAYLIPQHAQTGSWGLTRTPGFAFYARMAPLADCSRFTPPKGTAGLCERDDPSGRRNANWYIFSSQPPATRLYGVPPYPLTDVPPDAYRWRGEEPTRRFAWAVLVHQPLDYLASVAEGVANYVVPRTGRRSVFEYDHKTLIEQLHNRRFERAALPDITAYYSTGAGYHRRHVAALDDYGRLAKVEGLVMALLAALALAGWLLARDGPRDAAALFAASGFALAVLPVALLFYDARYAAPVAAVLAVAAAVGADRLADLIAALRARKA